jgi:hypothetical protein
VLWAFAAAAYLAAGAIVAYVMDWCGLAIRPFVVLPLSLIFAIGVFQLMRREIRSDREETIAFGAIVAAVLTWLLWLAAPSLLPPGSGPDLAHHLLLIDYIERHAALPHDPQLGALLGEMVSYTPGTHLLAVLAGAWTRTSGFQAAYPVVAVAVALKAGIVFLIARRMLPAGAPRTPFAVAAALLLFVPRDYFAGSFTELSFLAQVVSELFAVAMWLAIVLWDECPSALAAALVALSGMATFLAWPVDLGPPLLVFAAVVAFRSGLGLGARIRALGLAFGPIAAIAALHASGRLYALVIVRVPGYVAYPTIAMFGWWFLLLGSVGVIASALKRRTRSVAWLVAAIAVQAGVLYVVATMDGAPRPYMALKMAFLVIYPLAVAAALALAWSWVGIANLHAVPAFSRTVRFAWILVAILAIVIARPYLSASRPKPIVSQPLFRAGQWARSHVAPGCVDYLVGNVYTAYWLHISVLGNARASPRSGDDDTYQPKQTLNRWILGEGVPYAIAENIDGLPRDIRSSVDVLARFGPAAVVRRRGQPSCS